MNLDNVELLLVMVGRLRPAAGAGTLHRQGRAAAGPAWRIATVFFSFFAASAVTWYGWPPKLGIDLSGGSILVYEIDDQSKGPGTTVDMEKLVQAVTKRVNPGGVKEVTIRPYGVNQIEVIIPKADEAELDRIKNKISSTGLLEFRITANMRDHANLVELAQKLDTHPRAKLEHREQRRHARSRGPLGTECVRQTSTISPISLGRCHAQERQG